MTETKTKPEQRFKIDEDVIPPLYGVHKMRVVRIFWEDRNTYTGNKNGCWVYVLAFLTKKGNIDKRKDYRRFNENTLNELI
jgi:hypothetical protein